MEIFMKTAMLFVAAAAVATPAVAQHVHEDMQAQSQAPTTPPATPPAGRGAPQGRGPQQPPIDVPWNDAIPAGTAEHAARTLKEPARADAWVDIQRARVTARSAR